MGIYKDILNSVVNLIASDSRFSEISVTAGYTKHKKQTPVKKTDIAITYADINTFPSSVSGTAGTTKKKTMYDCEMTFEIKVMVPASFSSINCADIFSDICDILFSAAGKALSFNAVQCGNVYTDRAGGCILFTVTAKARAALSFS